MMTSEAKKEELPPLGAKVDTSEVTPFAKNNCKACRATGMITRVLGTAKTAPRIPLLCLCASRRFFKRNPIGVSVFFDSKKELRWRYDLKPETPEVVTSEEVEAAPHG